MMANAICIIAKAFVGCKKITCLIFFLFPINLRGMLSTVWTLRVGPRPQTDRRELGMHSHGQAHSQRYGVVERRG
jgi:hypothetical protein